MEQKQLEKLLAAMPFSLACGIELESAAADEVRARLPWSKERCTAGGALHGGALMTLADSAAALCAFLNLPAGATTTTVESKTNFLRAVREGAAHAVARPAHTGRSLIVVQTDLQDDQGRRVALVTQTQLVLAP